MVIQEIPENFKFDLFADVRAGLLRPGQKELPSKYLYDETGSALFDVISRLPAYLQQKSPSSFRTEKQYGRRAATSTRLRTLARALAIPYSAAGQHGSMDSLHLLKTCTSRSEQYLGTTISAELPVISDHPSRCPRVRACVELHHSKDHVGRPAVRREHAETNCLLRRRSLRPHPF
jgi:Histidine-specific methyltransferase, SAM-dependent